MGYGSLNLLFTFAAMKKTLILLIASLAFFPSHLFAWGKKGHSIVAEIAFTLSDNTTQKAIQKYLDGMSIAEAGCWMDEAKGNHKYDYMRTWHYVNIEKGSQYIPNKDENIVNALNKAIDQLEHKDKLSSEEIKLNLLIVFHLVGDLHQPLHVGYGVDKGGNEVQVKYLTHQSNLHKVWDSEIIDGENITVNDCLLLYNKFDKTDIAQLKVINVENWIHEPRSLLGGVYNIRNDTIDEAYVSKNKKVVEEQLLIAGIRLSAVLQKVFHS